MWGSKCYPDLASLPEPPQHALVIVPAPAVQAVLETGVKAGLKSATIYASQIGEGEDPEIVARGAALKALIDASGLVGLRAQLHGHQCAAREDISAIPTPNCARSTPGSVAPGHAVGRHAAISRPGRARIAG